MADRNLNKTARLVLLSFTALVCVALIVGCVGPSTSVKGTILHHTGEPLAEKEVILIPLLPDDKVTVI